jgi:hypothetical protein
MNTNIRIREKKHIKYLDKKTVLFKSKLEQIETAYNNNEARKFYQEVNSIRTGFKLQTIPITDKEVNIVSNKEKVLQR